MPHYDDNFGCWDEEGTDPEETAWFRRYVKENNVTKKCLGCGRMVRIMRQYAYCNSCAEARERGADI